VPSCSDLGEGRESSRDARAVPERARHSQSADSRLAHGSDSKFWAWDSQKEMAINYRTRFAYRIDSWDADGENVIEHLAGIEDLQVAKATYLAACQRWPETPITLRQGTRVIEDSRRTRLV
jgi:hypothetical protein